MESDMFVRLQDLPGVHEYCSNLSCYPLWSGTWLLTFWRSSIRWLLGFEGEGIMLFQNIGNSLSVSVD